MEVFNPILPKWRVYHVCKLASWYESWTDQWLQGDVNGDPERIELEAHTSEVMSEIKANNYEHPKDLQNKENPDGGPNDLLVVSRTALINVSTAPLTYGSKRALALRYIEHTQIYLPLPQRVDT